MFTDELRHRLKLGKYTRWAADLTDEQLEAVLWMVGEYAYRADLVLQLLQDNRGMSAWNQERFGRALVALQTLFRIVAGDRPDLEEAKIRIRVFLAQVREAAETGLALTPNESLALRWPVSSRGLLIGWVAAPVIDEYGLGCSGKWVTVETPEAAEFLGSLSRTPLGSVSRRHSVLRQNTARLGGSNSVLVVGQP